MRTFRPQIVPSLKKEGMDHGTARAVSHLFSAAESHRHLATVYQTEQAE